MHATTSPMLRRLVVTSALLGASAVPWVVSGPAAATVPAAKSCKSATKNISYLNTARIAGVKQLKAAAGCQTANAVSNTWMLRFNDHMPVQRFNVNFVEYRCKLVPTLPRNTQCIGGGTRIKFSAPTGG